MAMPTAATPAAEPISGVVRIFGGTSGITAHSMIMRRRPPDQHARSGAFRHMIMLSTGSSAEGAESAGNSAEGSLRWPKRP
jgi:hypothetical protein